MVSCRPTLFTRRNTMKHLLVAVLTIVSLVATADEAKQVSTKQFSGGVETAVSSQYLGKPGVIFHKDPQLETQLTLKWGNDKSAWYGGLWTSSALDNRSGDFDDEIDLWVGYQRFFKQVTLDGRLSYFAFEQFDEPGTDQWVIDLKATLEQVPMVKPHFQLRYFGEVGSKSPESGFFAFAGLSRSQPLGFSLPWATNQQTLDLGTETLWSFGALGRDAGYVGTKLWVSTTIPTSKRSYLTPSITYQLSAGDQDGGPGDYVDGNQWVYRLAWGFNF